MYRCVVIYPEIIEITKSLKPGYALINCWRERLGLILLLLGIIAFGGTFTFCILLIVVDCLATIDADLELEFLMHEIDPTAWFQNEA